MTQKFGKIDTTIIHKEVLELEKKLLNENDEVQILKIIDDLLSYNKILTSISGKYERFDKKYSMYFKYISKLIERTDNIHISTANYIKDNKILLKMLSKHINQFTNNLNLLEKNFELKEISKNDMLDIICEVFDNDFIDFVYNEFKTKKVHFNTCCSPNGIKRDYNGVCIDVRNKNYYIIDKDKKYYYYNLFSTIHEISHGFVNKKYSKDFTGNPFRESFSIFNELLLCKYLYNKNIAFNDCKLSDTFFFEALLDNCNSLYYWTYLIDSILDNGVTDDEIFKNIIKNEKFLLNGLLRSDIDEDDYFETLIYSLGRVIALEQYYKYIDDPEKAKYLFNKIYSNNSKISLDNQLDNLEINKMDFVTCKFLKKYYNDYKKRYIKSKI